MDTKTLRPKCIMDIAFTGSATDLVSRMRAGIEGAGGTFEGDSERGRFSVSAVVGRIEGDYTINGQTLHVEIQRKPVVVSCDTIEEYLRRQIS